MRGGMDGPHGRTGDGEHGNRVILCDTLDIVREDRDGLLTLREALGFLYHISALTRYSRSGGCFCFCLCSWGRYASVMAMSRERRGIGGDIRVGRVLRLRLRRDRGRHARQPGGGRSARATTRTK